MLFSQRQGLTPTLKDLQTEEVDGELLNRLWNALTVYYWENFHGPAGYDNIKQSNFELFLFDYWTQGFFSESSKFGYFEGCLFFNTHDFGRKTALFKKTPESSHY